MQISLIQRYVSALCISAAGLAAFSDMVGNLGYGLWAIGLLFAVAVTIYTTSRLKVFETIATPLGIKGNEEMSVGLAIAIVAMGLSLAGFLGTSSRMADKGGAISTAVQEAFSLAEALSATQGIASNVRSTGARQEQLAEMLRRERAYRDASKPAFDATQELRRLDLTIMNTNQVLFMRIDIVLRSFHSDGRVFIKEGGTYIVPPAGSTIREFTPPGLADNIEICASYEFIGTDFRENIIRLLRQREGDSSSDWRYFEQAEERSVSEACSESQQE